MHVFITGGANGIGRAAAEQLLRDGHEVTVFDKDTEALETLPEGVATYNGDVTDYEQTADVIQGEEFDVLVNCAGFQAQGAVEDMELATFRQHMETNYLGAVNATKAALPMLQENDGRVVNVSSLAGIISTSFLGGYCASKHALEGVTDSFRRELHDTEVDVILVEPTKIQTGFNEKGARHLRSFLSDSVFADRYREKVEQAESEGGLGGYPTETAADVLVTAIKAKRPRARYTAPRYLWITRALDAVLPTWLVDRLLWHR